MPGVHFGGKLLPEPWRLRFVTGNCMIKLGLRRRAHAGDHGFKCFGQNLVRIAQQRFRRR